MLDTSSSRGLDLRTTFRTMAPPNRRWWRNRTFLWILPFLVLLNYFVIFHWSFFEDLSRRVYPAASWTEFNVENVPPTPTSVPIPEPTDHKEAVDAPPPGAELADTGEQDNGLDYWTWDTQTHFRSAKVPAADSCLNFPAHLLQDVQIVLKTGTADSVNRTQAQVNSVVKCISNAIIVSDTDHPYGPNHHAQDILSMLPPKNYLNPDDLVAYETQKNASRDGIPLEGSVEGWKLDKYKFLSEIEFAVERSPYAKWYVFFESDTYVFWDNLFRLLDTYNHAEPWYFGSPSPGRKDSRDRTVWFAYGGAGFILSANAARRFTFNEKHRITDGISRVTDRFREAIQNDCCGDTITGYAIHEKLGLDIAGLWPMFNPHSLNGIPFSRLYWCEPVITLHKTHDEDYVPLYQWESSRDRKTPLLYADLISHLGLGDFETRDDWDNADWDGFSLDDDSPSHKSVGACKKACHTDDNCFQFTYHMRHCHMAKCIRLGQAKEPEGDLAALKDGKDQDRRFLSGWDTRKIRKWMKNNACDAPHWVKPSIKRKF